MYRLPTAFMNYEFTFGALVKHMNDVVVFSTIFIDSGLRFEYVRCRKLLAT